MSKEETIKVFQSIITAIENDDSFQGSIEYEVIDQNNFEVFAAYRTGNSKRVTYEYSRWIETEEKRIKEYKRQEELNGVATIKSVSIYPVVR
jgi:hypothetical protein